MFSSPHLHFISFSCIFTFPNILFIKETFVYLYTVILAAVFHVKFGTILLNRVEF